MPSGTAYRERSNPPRSSHSASWFGAPPGRALCWHKTHRPHETNHDLRQGPFYLRLGLPQGGQLVRHIFMRGTP